MKDSDMKRAGGFTLIELMVVTVVIVALMGIMFRLTGIVGSVDERKTTIARMQRLENCLSGYYAAFGQYPPVPLQGATRNIFQKVCNLHQIQYGDEDDSEMTAERVRAACRAQPVAALYPPSSKVAVNNNWNDLMDSEDLLGTYQQMVQAYLQNYSSGYANIVSAWTGTIVPYEYLATNEKKKFENYSDFTQFQMFRFGLMSFLLPRYRFMLEGAKKNGPFYNTIDSCKQWTEYNTLPARMDSGVPYETWGRPSGGGSSSAFVDVVFEDDRKAPDERKRWQIDLIPSQAVCARWMPNLAGIVSGPSNSFFGVMVSTDRSNWGLSFTFNDPSHIRIPYSLGGTDHGDSCDSGSPYILFEMSVKDGWGHDFYYYSPPPYQTYVLWSSGAWNDLTFPPWIDMDVFKQKYSKFYNTAVSWAADDIVFMGTGEKQ